MNIKVDSRTTFHSILKCLCNKIEPSYCGMKMSISPKYGIGQIQSLQLSDKISVMITDMCLKEGLDVQYKLPFDHFEVAYCLNGAMNAMGKGAAEFKQGQICLSAPNWEAQTITGDMAYLPGQRYQGISFAFSETLPGFPENNFQELLYNKAESLLSNGGTQFSIMEASGSMEAAFLQMIRRPILAEFDMLYSESKMLEIISLVASELSRTTTSVILDDYETAQVKKVKALLSSNFQNPPTVSEISSMLGINRNKLQSGFRLIYGDTIFGYYRKIRLEYAKVLLEANSTSVENVALLVGYNSVSQFRTAFKNHFGILPSQCKLIT